MTERKLRLVNSDISGPALAVDQQPVSVPAEAEEVEAEPAQPTLTEAEQVEAARFKALVKARAARQAMLRRIKAELDDLDEISSAA